MLRRPAAVKGQSTIYWDRTPLDQRYVVGYTVGFLWINGYKRWAKTPVIHTVFWAPDRCRRSGVRGDNPLFSELVGTSVGDDIPHPKKSNKKRRPGPLVPGTP